MKSAMSWTFKLQVACQFGIKTGLKKINDFSRVSALFGSDDGRCVSAFALWPWRVQKALRRAHSFAPKRYALEIL